MSFLIGLMIGSLNKIWPWQNITNKNNSIIDHQMIPVFPQNYNGGDPEMNKAIVFLFLGFISIFILEKIKSFIENSDFAK